MCVYHSRPGATVLEFIFLFPPSIIIHYVELWMYCYRKDSSVPRLRCSIAHLRLYNVIDVESWFHRASDLSSLSQAS